MDRATADCVQACKPWATIAVAGVAITVIGVGVYYLGSPAGRGAFFEGASKVAAAASRVAGTARDGLKWVTQPKVVIGTGLTITALALVAVCAQAPKCVDAIGSAFCVN